MTDIEERAKEYAFTTLPTTKVRELREIAYKKGATDQDPISRADERKKVIEKACEWLTVYNRIEAIIDGEKMNLHLFTDEVKQRFKQAMEE